MKKILPWKHLLASICLLFFCVLSFAQYHNGANNYPSLQAAIDAASPGDAITIDPGTYAIPSTINVNKSVTINGGSASTTKLQTSGSNSLFSVTAPNVVIKNLEIEKTDVATDLQIIYVQGNNFELSNTNIHGLYAVSTDPTTRGLIIAVGTLGINIHDNTFKSLRQPAYINNGVSGIVNNNFTAITRGWVVVSDATVTFSNNTWGSGANVNYYDIAIIDQSSANLYPDIVTMSNNNNDAIIENQKFSPAILSIVHVDKNKVGSTNNGSILDPYTTLAPSIPRVAPGGRIVVASGTYNENVTINNAVSLRGANYGVSCSSGRTTESVVNGTGGSGTTTIKVNSDNVTIDGFSITNHNGSLGISESGRSSLDFEHNLIYDIGNPTTGQASSWGIDIEAGTSQNSSNITVSNNCINNIRGGANAGLSGTAGKTNNGSGGGILVGSSGDTKSVSGVVINSNIIDHITASTVAFGDGGHGAYGVQLNPHGGSTGNVISSLVTNNQINTLEGLWAHGVGLEGRTPNANIANNSIDGLVDHKGNTDAIGVFLQDNDASSTVTINNNSFTNMAFAIAVDPVNPNQGTVSATCNWYGTTDGSVIASRIGGPINYIPYLTNGTDNDPATGFQPVANSCSGGTHVHDITQNTYFITIQAAVNAANLNDVIVVDPGTYNENVTVNKSLTIEGAQSGNDARTRSGAESSVNGGGANFTITADNVTIDGFTLNGPVGSAAIVMEGGNTGETIENNIINNPGTAASINTSNTVFRQNVVNNVFASSTDGFQFNNTPVHDVNISNNNFSGADGFKYHANITIIGPLPSGENSNVVVTGNLSNGDGTLVALFTTNGSQITGNTVIGDKNTRSSCNPDPSPCGSSAIYVGGGNSNVTVSANTVSSAGTAVNVANDFGDGANSGITIIGNDLHNNITGIKVGSTAVSVAGTVVANNNSIVQNSSFGFNNLSTFMADATCNWWGNSTGPTSASNPGGTGDAISGNVNFTPWSVSTAPNSCSGGTHVHDITQHTDFITIQAAVNAATSGDVILVDPGTYNENVVINTPVSLRGANYGVSCSSGRGAESVVNGQLGDNSATIKINSNNVTIDGFTITNHVGPYGISEQGRSNISVMHNIITDVGNNTTGSGPSDGVQIESNSAANNVSVTYNCISNIRGGQNGPANGNNGSGFGIGVNSTNSTFDITGLNISYNSISNISASTTNGTGGKGAYGVIINVGAVASGKAINSVVSNNDINSLNGRWAHGVGLEGNTPGAVVTNNAFSTFTSVAGDNFGVTLQQNTGTSTVQINQNSFLNAGLAIGNNLGQGTVNGTCNWYGTTDVTLITPKIVGPVTYIPYLTSTDPNSCNGSPQSTISFTATTTSGSSSSTAGGNPSTVSISFCQGDHFTFSNFSSTPNMHVGSLEFHSSTPNVTYNGNPVGSSNDDIKPDNMNAFFSATYGAYGLSSGTSGTIDQTYTPYYDANNNNQYDAGIDILGTPVTLHYDIHALPVTGPISGTTSVCSGSNSGHVSLDPGQVVGSVIMWEYSTDNGMTWNTISNTGYSQSYGNLVQTTSYRAVVQNGVCDPVNSDAAVITVNPLPTATILVTSTNFCSGLTLTAIPLPAGAYNYLWTPGGETSVSKTLTSANTNGNYTVKVTGPNGCSATSSPYNFVKQNSLNNYTILGLMDVKLGQTNTVNGPVGNNMAGKKVSVDKGSTINGFIKASVINLMQPVTVTGGTFLMPAGVTLPPMFLNTATVPAPNFNVPDNTTATIGANYNNLTIGKNCIVTVTGTVYGKVAIHEGAQVTFTQPDISINDLSTDPGTPGKPAPPPPPPGKPAPPPPGNLNPIYTTMNFNGSTVRIKNTVNIGDRNRVNGTNTTFYMGDSNPDAEKFTVNGNDTKVTANVYMPNGTLAVHGGKDAICVMTGTYIAQNISSDNLSVTWNGYDCSNPPPSVRTDMYVGNSQQVISKFLPETFALSNYPNPFAGTSTIKYDLPYDSKVSIKVYDVLGREVTTLVNNEDKKAGSYTVEFNGNRFTKGSLYYRIIAKSSSKLFEQTNKMIQLQ